MPLDASEQPRYKLKNDLYQICTQPTSIQSTLNLTPHLTCAFSSHFQSDPRFTLSFELVALSVVLMLKSSIKPTVNLVTPIASDSVTNRSRYFWSFSFPAPVTGLGAIQPSHSLARNGVLSAFFAVFIVLSYNRGWRLKSQEVSNESQSALDNARVCSTVSRIC